MGTNVLQAVPPSLASRPNSLPCGEGNACWTHQHGEKPLQAGPPSQSGAVKDAGRPPGSPWPPCPCQCLRKPPSSCSLHCMHAPWRHGSRRCCSCLVSRHQQLMEIGAWHAYSHPTPTCSQNRHAAPRNIPLLHVPQRHENPSHLCQAGPQDGAAQRVWGHRQAAIKATADSPTFMVSAT